MSLLHFVLEGNSLMKSHVVCMPVEQCTLCFAVICMKSFNTKERNFISSRKCLKWNCSIYYKYLLRQNLYYVIQICEVQIYSIQNISLVEINNLLQMYFEEIYCHESLLVVFFFWFEIKCDWSNIARTCTHVLLWR